MCPNIPIIVLCDSNSSPCNSASRPLSAGDLPSAESILEVHEREIGCDTAYLDGLVWDTRGTVLLDSSAPASTPPRTTLLVALGAQIKVQAHVLGHAEGRKPAVAYLDVELVGFAQPVALRSRLYKRRNQLTLVCAPAPAIVLEESLTPNPPTRSRLRGKPILIFGWAQWCGDCRSQVAARGLIRAKYTDKVSIVALARCYETDKTLEKALIKKAWAEFDQPFQGAPVLIPPAAMERYGVSSTPTFILLDKDGKVTHYLPCRLTEAALEKLLGALPCQITGTAYLGIGASFVTTVNPPLSPALRRFDQTDLCESQEGHPIPAHQTGQLARSSKPQLAATARGARLASFPIPACRIGP